MDSQKYLCNVVHHYLSPKGVAAGAELLEPDEVVWGSSLGWGTSAPNTKTNVHLVEESLNREIPGRSSKEAKLQKGSGPLSWFFLQSLLG